MPAVHHMTRCTQSRYYFEVLYIVVIVVVVVLFVCFFFNLWKTSFIYYCDVFLVTLSCPCFDYLRWIS